MIQSPQPQSQPPKAQQPLQKKTTFTAWALLLIPMLVAAVLVFLPPQHLGLQPTHKVIMAGMRFSPDTLYTHPGERVVIEITNKGKMGHDLRLGGRTAQRVRPGQTVLFDAGEFTESTLGWCTISGHKQAGMILEVRVQP